MRKSLIVHASAAILACLTGLPLWAQQAQIRKHGVGTGIPRSASDSQRRGLRSVVGSSDLDSRETVGWMPMTPTVGPKSSTDILSHNTKLSSQVGGLLPAGTNVQEAAAGFKNLGQFVAAVHVAHNLGIPFDQLKAKMTGANSESLGKVIQSLKPEANSKAEVKKAQKQAKEDIRLNTD